MLFNEIAIKTVEAYDKGALSFFEALRDIPFEIKRIYYIHSAGGGVARGGHAHKALQQFLFCPYGDIEITLNDGKNVKSYTLSNPTKGLYIPCGVWRDMIWRLEKSVLCVAASDYYDESDYIRDWNIFKSMLADNYWSNKHDS